MMNDKSIFLSKVIDDGETQVVILPSECRIEAEEVLVSKMGDVVFLHPKKAGWERFFEAISMFTPDFMSEPREQIQQEREPLV